MTEKSHSNHTDELNSGMNEFTEDLISASALMNLLGYKDLRTVKNWCSKNGVPLIKMGKQVYTLKHEVINLIARHTGQSNTSANLPTPTVSQRQNTYKGSSEASKKFLRMK